jgi:surface carbohydrate biosynthesis protein
MEIKVRELEGRSLLALAAAERGHHVLLGDVERYLAARPGAFPAGVFHDKALTPSARRLRLHAAVAAAGHLITSQDEEHFLALPSFEVPARTRFSARTLGAAARSFAWGAHEADALRAAYPDLADRVVATGSPRADLWRPELGVVHDREPLPVPTGRPVVLLSSNFSAVLDVNPLWVKLRDKRERYEGPDDPVEFDYYTFTAEKVRVLREFVRAARRIARAHPEALVVVRPHPIEQDGAWEDLVGPEHGVLVTREGTLSAWIRRAALVIQNGCTSGYEAALLGTPVVAFHPHGIFADHPSNAFGRRATDDAGLDELVAAALRGRVDDGWRDPEGDAVLARRLTALDGPLAADRIVDAWETLARDPRPAPSDAAVRTARRATLLRERAGTTKARLTDGGLGPRGGAFRTAHKLPPISADEVDAFVAALRRATGRFGGVEARVLAPDLVAFRPAGRGRAASRP